jgi:tetratricopeptide (TPR) repeat protein
MTGRNELALAAGERSLELAEKLGISEQLAYATNDLGYTYQAIGNIEDMNNVLEIAIPLWRELGNLPMLTDILTSHANNLVFVGQSGKALELSDEDQTISKSLTNPWSESFTLFTGYFVHWDRMEIRQALEAMRRCIALARAVGFVGGLVTMRNYQVQILLEVGRAEETQEVIYGIREAAERNIPLFLGGASAADVLIAMYKGDLEEATNILRSFISDDPPSDLMNSFTLEFALCEVLNACTRRFPYDLNLNIRLCSSNL